MLCSGSGGLRLRGGAPAEAHHRSVEPTMADDYLLAPLLAALADIGTKLPDLSLLRAKPSGMVQDYHDAWRETLGGHS